MTAQKFREILKRQSQKRLPDQSILNMTMGSFIFGNFSDDKFFYRYFLKYSHGKGNSQIIISDMTVREFIEKITPDMLIALRDRIGVKSIAKIKTRLARSHIEWK